MRGCLLCTTQWDFHSASSLNQQSAGKHVCPLGHKILIPTPAVFTLTRQCCKYQFYSFWFEPITARLKPMI